MTRRPGGALTARLAGLLPGRPTPFVTQSQLIDLVTTDRRDIARQLRQAHQVGRRPHRGMPAAPYLLIADWTRFLRIPRPGGPRRKPSRCNCAG